MRCWQIEPSNGTTIPKAQQTAGGPVLDVCWSPDGSKVFTACGDKMARMWDLGSNQYVQIAAHDAPGNMMNKAVCTTASVAYGWAGAVKEVRSPFGVFVPDGINSVGDYNSR